MTETGDACAGRWRYTGPMPTPSLVPPEPPRKGPQKVAPTPEQIAQVVTAKLKSPVGQPDKSRVHPARRAAPRGARAADGAGASGELPQPGGLGAGGAGTGGEGLATSWHAGQVMVVAAPPPPAPARSACPTSADSGPRDPALRRAVPVTPARPGRAAWEIHRGVPTEFPGARRRVDAGMSRDQRHRIRIERSVAGPSKPAEGFNVSIMPAVPPPAATTS